MISRVSGGINLLLIAGIIAAILGSAVWKPGIKFDVYGTTLELQNIMRDGAAGADRHAVAGAHAQRASRGQRLQLGADRAKWRSCSPASSSASFRCWPCSRPGRTAPSPGCWPRSPMRDGRPQELAYFWLTGMLSAFLDNAPTYLVFFELAGGDAARADGCRSRATLAAISHGRGLHGRADLYRQRAELHGLCHRRRARREDAELLRLHGLVGLVLLPVFALLTFVSAAKLW